MAKKRLNMYLGAFTVGVALLATQGCSDSWDEHYSPEGSSNSEVTETLWDVISNNPDLTRFADILEHARYYRDEKHRAEYVDESGKTVTYTYADILKSGQVTTVWAPVNSAFTEDEYKDWLQRCETDGYNVQQQLCTNHIALWRHPLSGSEIDTIKVMNGKNLIFDKGAATFQSVQIDTREGMCNIAAANGTLHCLKGIAPFNFNLYEYVKFSGDLPLFQEYMISKDTTYFVESASIEGKPDIYGNPTYVDSVYRMSNQLVGNSYLPQSTDYDKFLTNQLGYNAHVEAEDSMFIMITPTDAGWNAAYDKLKSFYVYADKYENKVKGNSGTTEYIEEYQADSVQEQGIKQNIIAPLVFNIHKQPKIGGIQTGTPWTLEHFIETAGAEAEYFLNMRGDTLRSLDTWDKTTLFNGTPKKMSNGYAYVSDEWNFPVEYYKPDVHVEVNGLHLFYKTNDAQSFKGRGSTRSFNNTAFAEVTERYGKVSKNNFYLLEPSGTTNPQGEIRLQGNLNEAYVPNARVMSGTYDVKLVLVPYWYKLLSDAGSWKNYYCATYSVDPEAYDTLGIDTTFMMHYIDSISNLEKNKFTAQVRYANNAKNGKDVLFPTSPKPIEYDAKKVDTVTVIENFTFPYSYKDVRNSYPTLVLVGKPSAQEVRKGYIREICIDRIILESKEKNQ